MNELLGALFPYALLAGVVGCQALFLTAWHRAHKFHREGMERLKNMK